MKEQEKYVVTVFQRLTSFGWSRFKDFSGAGGGVFVYVLCFALNI